jgi:hypothetical protein
MPCKQVGITACYNFTLSHHVVFVFCIYRQPSTKWPLPLTLPTLNFHYAVVLRCGGLWKVKFGNSEIRKPGN